MDARPGYPGYAAFGRVVEGMPVIRRILASPTGAGMGGALILHPILIRRAVRLDGKPRPTGQVKPWLIGR
jgi:peptidyl-prolyl cis-trans isomerase A (cyclophilin A)